MASAVHLMVSPYTYSTHSKLKLPFEVNSIPSSGSIKEYESSFVGLQEKNQRLKSRAKRKSVKDDKDLEVLWDDGYGTKTTKNYLEEFRDLSRPDGGPPRWFCPAECGKPLRNSPTLLFLAGLDGVGSGLTLHHKSLGKVFEVQCLHIPISDRTPFEGLVTLVDEAVNVQHLSSPDKPIYLVGESFGGCLALVVAARNPELDLVVILVNPGTSFDRSPLRVLIPLLEGLPEGFCDPSKKATIDIDCVFSNRFKIEQFLANLIEFQTYVRDVIDINPKETILWKLKLLDTAASSANSRLRAVKAEVLVISGGNDRILPRKDEAERLQSSLKNCIVRHYKQKGHTILLEDGISLLTIIKVSGKYRRSRKRDIVSDFLPPSMSEFKCFSNPVVRFFKIAGSPAIFSTMADGSIVRGLSGVPDEGPVILVGNHMLIGSEIYSLVEEFLRHKKILIHGIAHPALFSDMFGNSSDDLSPSDCFRVMGAVPYTPFNFFKLLSAKKHVLLYPGGIQEGLHNKGEEHKIKWPKEPEFVRMAARFRATIVPFGSVGEDDIISLDFDYEDLAKNPAVNDIIRYLSSKAMSIRGDNEGEVANEEIYMPGLSPRIPPGRMYSLFGKPIETKGKEELIKDREYAKEMYLKVKSEVKRNIDYLLKMREEDPYRNIVDRTLYCALYTPLSDIPAFDP